MKKNDVSQLVTLTLAEAITESASRIGSKVLRLAQLAKQGYAVPPAVILPADTVATLWRGDRVEVPNCVLDVTWQRCQKLLGPGPLIVRSSGREDGETLSFAGQFDSVPNVGNKDELQRALIACISSSRSSGSRLYNEAAGTIEVGNSFAVMIMPQRQCVFAGIMFSQMHLNGDGTRFVVVQLARGANFGLTSGTEVGDIVYLERETGRVVWSIPDNRTVSECSDSKLAELYRLACNLERFFGFGVDVEWGTLPDGTVEIFQTRPITTKGGASSSDLRLRVILQTLSKMSDSVNKLHQCGVNVGGNYWSDQNIAELITDHPSRMAFGVFTHIFAHGQGAIRTGRNQMGYDIGQELEEGFFELIGGRPRCSIAHDALTYRIDGISLEDYAVGFVGRYLASITNDIQLANYPEVVLYDQNPSLQSLIKEFGEEKGMIYAACYDTFFTNIRDLETSIAEEFTGSFEPGFRSYMDERRRAVASLVAGSNTTDLVTVSKEILEHLRTVSCVMFVKVARLGFFAYARLRRRLEGAFGEAEGRSRLDQMTAGLEDDASMLFNVRLADFRDGRISLSQLLDEFGHLGPNELEIANPRYRNHVNLIEQLAASIQGNPASELRHRASQASQVTQETVTAFDAEGAQELQRDLAVARRYLALRERVKYFYLMEYDCFRQVLTHLTGLLGIEEYLIFELDPRELNLVVSDPAGAISLMRDRYQERTLVYHMYVPPVLSQENVGAIGRESYDPEAKVLMGIGVTTLVTTGRAIVVLDPQDTDKISQLVPGCVLVTKTTDPTWAPIIAAVGGNGALVTEIGGPLAHGAIVARDLGIACVQNVPGVTKRFRTGDLIQVDGKHGTVTLVEG
ncbi:MAG: hypothetical protein HY974_01355 [Candidatus Kerfeldbacteria bacterium]|nr:hypothetical protein [Candidatus Kerfeldbacteria bacterium]